MTEYEKMVSGKLYDPTDIDLVQKRAYIRELLDEYNCLGSNDIRRNEILKKMFKSIGDNVCIEKSLRLDYGCNITIGNNFYANNDCKIYDVGLIDIGDDVMFGPSVILASPMHPLVSKQRNVRTRDNGEKYDLEYGKPIKIGNGVWLAAGVIVCGGVTIGDNSVIGAGSVVVKDIPSNVFACGNPCKVKRKITENDLIKES